MAVGNDKERTLLTLTKEAKRELQEIAEKEHRTLSNLIQSILYNYLDEKRESSQE